MSCFRYIPRPSFTYALDHWPPFTAPDISLLHLDWRKGETAASCCRPSCHATTFTPLPFLASMGMYLPRDGFLPRQAVPLHHAALFDYRWWMEFLEKKCEPPHVRARGDKKRNPTNSTQEREWWCRRQARWQNSRHTLSTLFSVPARNMQAHKQARTSSEAIPERTHLMCVTPAPPCPPTNLPGPGRLG